MANLPANRTKLNAAVANQQSSVIASSLANRETLIEAFDTIDLLNQKVDGLVSGGTLSPVPPDFVKRQAIINGNFAINQRVKTGNVVLTAGQYGHDRWKGGAGGCSYTFAKVENVTTITITAGSLVQIIEGVNLYSGTYNLSWAGTAQGKIGAGTYGVSGNKASVVGGTNLAIEFNMGTLSQVQLCAGDAALPFQPRSFAEEFLLCQRFCNVYRDDVASEQIIGAGVGVATTLASIPIIFSVQMRIAPSLVATASDWKLSDGTTTPIPITGVSLFANNTSKSSCNLRADVAAGVVLSRPYFLQSVSVGKAMIFDAEI